MTNSKIFFQRVLKTIRTARLPPDMVATELDAESSSTEKMVEEGERLYAQRKELQVR